MRTPKRERRLSAIHHWSYRFRSPSCTTKSTAASGTPVALDHWRSAAAIECANSLPVSFRGSPGVSVPCRRVTSAPRGPNEEEMVLSSICRSLGPEAASDSSIM